MLKINHLSKNYKVGKLNYEVLKDISFEVDKGEFVAVMGPSGSGKTTLLNSISCFIPIDQGEIQLDDQKLAGLKEDQLAEVRNRSLGFVFQDFMLLDGLTVFENICMPQIIAKNDIKKMEVRANKLCEAFGLSHIKNNYPNEISGGEKQRTAVARALINQPYMLLADEPTGNLDSKSCRVVIDAFLQAKEELGATIFMVTHDSYVASFCDRVIILKDGSINMQLTRDCQQEAFMNKLLETLKQLGASNHN